MANGESIEGVIREARESLLRSREDDGSWSFPPYLGGHYVAQFFVIRSWLGRPITPEEGEPLRNSLKSSQLAGGGWHGATQPESVPASLDATVSNYWALKTLGEDVEGEVLGPAKDCILGLGGLEECSTGLKVLLAATGNWHWDQVPGVPRILLREKPSIGRIGLAQWVGPHLLPIACLKKMQPVRPLGADFRIAELAREPGAVPPLGNKGAASESSRESIRKRKTDEWIDRLVRTQLPEGTWGGYATSTLLSVMALDEHLSRVDSTEIADCRNRALAFVERLVFDAGDSSYHGVLEDGHYWDTALTLLALLRSGVAPDQVQDSAAHLVAVQHEDGGFPFGHEFHESPDTDDTAIVAMALEYFPEHEGARAKALSWLRGMQNRDGGWGAFSRAGIESPLIEPLATNFADSAEILDRSCADLTGHVIEALGSQVPVSREVAKTVTAAIKYLKKSRIHSLGGWQGRWGIDYLYGTSAAITGLGRVRVRESRRVDGLIHRGSDFLAGLQNTDGGFGETSESYVPGIGVATGPSTPTQTAWVLLALLESPERHPEAIRRAARFLVDQFGEGGSWRDPYAVGTGHPRIVYMHYPSYAKVFPLLALARFRERLGGL